MSKSSGVRSSFSAPKDASPSLNIGDRVIIKKTKKTGHLAFIGPTNFAEGTWAGLILEETGTGKNNGTVNGVTYFSAPENTGLFVLSSQVEKTINREPHFKSQNPMTVSGIPQKRSAQSSTTSLSGKSKPSTSAKAPTPGHSRNASTKESASIVNNLAALEDENKALKAELEKYRATSRSRQASIGDQSAYSPSVQGIPEIDSVESNLESTNVVNEQIRELEKLVAEKDTAIDILKKSMEVEIEEAVKRQLSELQSPAYEADTAATNLAEMTKQIAQLQNEISKEKSTAKFEIQKLQDQLFQKDHLIEKSQIKIKELEENSASNTSAQTILEKETEILKLQELLSLKTVELNAIAQRPSESDNLRQALAGKEMEIEELRAKQSEKDKTIEENRKNFDKIISEVSKTKEDMEALRYSLAEKEAQIERYKDQVAVLEATQPHSNSNHLSEILADKEDVIFMLKQQLDSKSHHEKSAVSDEEIKSLRDQLATATSKTKTFESEFKSQRESLENEIKRLSDARKHDERVIDTLKEQLASAISKLEVTESKASAEKTNLENEISLLSLKIEQYSEKLQNLENSLMEALNSAEFDEKKREKLALELQEKEEEIKKLNAQLDENMKLVNIGESTSFIAIDSTGREDLIFSLKQRLGLKTLDDEKNTISLQMEDLQRTITVVEEKDAIITNLTKQLEEAENELFNFETKLKTKEAAIELLTLEAAKIQESVRREKDNDQTEFLKERIDNLLTEREILSEKILGFEKEISEGKAASEDMNKKFEAINESVLAYERETTEKLNTIKAEKAAAEAINATITEELQKLTKQRDELIDSFNHKIKSHPGEKVNISDVHDIETIAFLLAEKPPISESQRQHSNDTEFEEEAHELQQSLDVLEGELDTSEVKDVDLREGEHPDSSCLDVAAELTKQISQESNNLEDV